MTVRAKMQLQQITKHCWSTEAHTLTFQTCYDPSIPEDRRFTKATPNGQITMQVDNPAALAHLTLGTYYYVDFSPVETP